MEQKSNQLLSHQEEGDGQDNNKNDEKKKKKKKKKKQDKNQACFSSALVLHCQPVLLCCGDGGDNK